MNQLLKKMKHHIITFENLEQVKEKIRQPAVYWIMFFLETITGWYQ